MHTESDPLVSILVLNWNGSPLIEPFFESLDLQTFGMDRVETIFIDNASSDDSVEHFLATKRPYARLLQTGANLGYAGGNNRGFHEARGRYVIVCNNDLELAPEWLASLIRTVEVTGADVVVPKLVDVGSGRIGNAGSEVVSWSNWPIIERGVGADLGAPEFDVSTEVTAFCGASPLFRREFLEDVGLFDGHFFLYWEDGDLSWRGQSLGKRYVYEPAAVALHRTSSSTGGSESPTFVHYVNRNRLLILIKHARLHVMLSGFKGVLRDHVLLKVRDLTRAMRSGSGRRVAAGRLWMGFKIFGGVARLTPLMLLKRWGIAKEERL